MTKLINGNPRWQDVEELALRFQMIDESNSFDKPVDMWHSEVNREKNFCGTSACHGGWYAAYSDLEDVTDYTQGKELMATDLGFEGGSQLKFWAEHNPELWGNLEGWDMFQHKNAFGKPSKINLTLTDISKHWMKVAGRLYKLQELQ